jgi:hypothetical protein
MLNPTANNGKAPKSSEGGKSPSAASKPPFNLELIILDEKLASLPTSAHETAHHDPDAGKVLRKAKLWVESARAWVYGKPEVRVIGKCECGGDIITDQPRQQPTADDPDPVDQGECNQCGNIYTITASEAHERINAEIIDAEPSPMRSTDVRAWIRKNAGIRISATDIRNWNREHKIRQVKDQGQPRYYASDLIRTHLAHLDSKRRSANGTTNAR